MATSLPGGGFNPQNIPALVQAGVISPQQAQEMMARAQPMAPMQAAPSMSQADFSGYGKTDPAAQQRQNMQLQQILRQRAAQEQALQQQGGLQ